MVSKFVVTFFDRDERGRRRYRFEQQYYYYNCPNTGQLLSIEQETLPEMVHRMFDWIDAQPIAKTLKSYGVPYAFTDISPSSVIITITADSEEMVEEIIVTLRLFAGRDIRIRDPEKAMPRRHKEMRLTERDRYAR